MHSMHDLRNAPIRCNQVQFFVDRVFASIRVTDSPPKLVPNLFLKSIVHMLQGSCPGGQGAEGSPNLLNCPLSRPLVLSPSLRDCTTRCVASSFFHPRGCPTCLPLKLKHTFSWGCIHYFIRIFTNALSDVMGDGVTGEAASGSLHMALHIGWGMAPQGELPTARPWVPACVGLETKG